MWKSLFRMAIALAVVALLASVACAERQTVYVNNVVGSDSFNGLSPDRAGDGKTGPCASIMGALKKADVGSRISITRTGADYLETVLIKGLNKGTPADPLVIDGNGATVNGLLPIPASKWHRQSDDIYWMENGPGHNELSGMPNSNWLTHLKHQGWFAEPQAPSIFFLDGKPAPHTNSLETIPQGGFFYDTQSDPRRIYVRLPAGRKIEDVKIEFPQNQGVMIFDDYVVIRNLRSIYSIDDGFAAKSGIGLVFENITGAFNCDQGFSMHHEVVSIVDGGLFERNGGCGICDVQNCTSIFRNVIVKDNMIGGALMMGLSHSFLKCRFSGNQGAQVTASKGTSLMLVDCSVDGGGGQGIGGDQLRMVNCTLENCKK